MKAFRLFLLLALIFSFSYIVHAAEPLIVIDLKGLDFDELLK